MSNHNRSIAYRAEIDGLRAIAVLSVIIYHMRFAVNGSNPLSGGFIGVDIFFVISGYLISSILINGYLQGNLQLSQFYERRARRILPILLLVISASLLPAIVLLLPREFTDYSYQILTSIFSISNFYFWLEDPYWAAESYLKPFLHTWSLGVEEQFYIFMPMILMLVGRKNKSNLLFIFAVLFSFSLLYAQWASIKHPNQSFYLIPSRAWELLAGAILAAKAIKPEKKETPKLWKYLPSLGLGMIVFSIFWFDESTLHPSLYTLIPTIGTMLIIQYANDDDPTIKLLKTKFFVGIGLISYSLYIWHFPIFAFATIDDLFASNIHKFGWLALVFLLSFVFYFAIEKPFRNFDYLSSKRFFTIIIIWIIVLVSIAILGVRTGFDFRMTDALDHRYKTELVPNETWFYTDQQEKGRIILVGDSQAVAIAPTFKDWANDKGYDFAKSATPGCPLILGINRVEKKSLKQRRLCTSSAQKKRMKFLKETEPSIVVMTGRLTLFLEETGFDNSEGGTVKEMSDFIQNEDKSLKTKKARNQFLAKQYRKTIKELTRAGHKVVIIYPIPEVGQDVPQTMRKRMGLNWFAYKDTLSEKPFTTSHKVFKKRNKKAIKLLNGIKGSNVYRINPEKLICNTSIKGRCLTHDDQALYYSDRYHLSEAGANLIIEPLDAILRKIEE